MRSSSPLAVSMHWAGLAQMANNTSAKHFPITCQHWWQISYQDPVSLPLQCCAPLLRLMVWQRRYKCNQQAFSRFLKTDLMCTSPCELSQGQNYSAEKEVELAGRLRAL